MKRKQFTVVAALAAAVLTAGGTAYATQAPAPRHERPHLDSRERTEAHNKKVALAFIDLAFNRKKPQEAADRYIGATYTQHSPGFADGKKAFVAAVKDYTAQFPQLNEDIKRVAADRNLVYLHTHETTSPKDRGSAIVDIFRLERGKIVEHWDVTQAVPETSANDNTMF